MKDPWRPKPIAITLYCPEAAVARYEATTIDRRRYWRGAFVAAVFGAMAALAVGTGVYHEIHGHNAARVAAEQ